MKENVFISDWVIRLFVSYKVFKLFSMKFDPIQFNLI